MRTETAPDLEKIIKSPLLPDAKPWSDLPGWAVGMRTELERFARKVHDDGAELGTLLGELYTLDSHGILATFVEVRDLPDAFYSWVVRQER